MEKKWADLKPPKPQSGSFSSNEERKYRILFDYAQKNWKKFQCIRIKDVITSFILQEPFDEFAKFVKGELSKDNPDQGQTSDKDLIKKKLHEIEKEYKRHHELTQKLPKLNEENDNDIEKLLKFYFEESELPDFSNKLKDLLRKISKDNYTKIYQVIGDNIRSSGNAFRKEDFSPSNIFSIARSTNKLIKLLRKKHDEVFIVIDTIRNPFEATFFRDRYSAFYLIAVNCPNDDRIKRLQRSCDYRSSELKNIDNKEYEDKLKSYKLFISQNIKKCIEISDIFFTNPTYGESDFRFLKRQLVWYISLMMHPGLVNPTCHERAMQIAYNARLNSGCISRQVGAVVTDEYFSIKSVGWNNTPQGQVPCILRNAKSLIEHDDKSAYSDYENNNNKFRQIIENNFGHKKVADKETILQGRHLSFCFKDIENCLRDDKNQVHTRSLHAEENAFLQISKYGGQGLNGGFLFTTASPCELCAKKAYQLGIKEILYIDPYPGIAKEHILTGGNKRPTLTLFHGAIGRAYHQLFQPILPYKDELEMFLGLKWHNRKADLEKQVAELKKQKADLEKQVAELKKQVAELQNKNGGLKQCTDDHS
jgi:dCMP deaminase